MTFSYGVATGDLSNQTRDYVRLLTTDTDSGGYVFEDEELALFLAQAGDDALLAAATALETMATNEALVSKRIKILDLTTDGPAVARELRERATALRAQAAAGTEDEPAFAIAEQIFNPFGWQERSMRLGLAGLDSYPDE